MNEETIRTLDKILPVVERVHGEHHPELHRVAALYAELKAAPSAEVFSQLRQTTGDYTVPVDACPTFEKTYALLRSLDETFAR